jgi:transcription-repair coupling factor (superfamily II helicase)
MRWAAMKLGFEKITLKNNKMLAYFLSKQDSEYYNSSMFKAVLSYAQKTPKQTNLKEQNSKLWLTIENIKSVDEAIVVFEKITGLITHELPSK